MQDGAVAQVAEKSESHYLLTIENLDSDGVAIDDPSHEQSANPVSIRLTFDDGEQFNFPSSMLLELAMAGIAPSMLPRKLIQ